MFALKRSVAILAVLVLGGSAPSLLDDAIELHGRGDVDGAFALYELVVADLEEESSGGGGDGDGGASQQRASWALASHNMALVEHGRGHHALALALVDRATRLDPSAANHHHSRGFLHRHYSARSGGGSMSVAVEAYRSALRLAPSMVASHAELANCLHYQVAGAFANSGGADFASYREALDEAVERYTDALAASAAAALVTAASATATGSGAVPAPTGLMAPLSLHAEADLRNDLAICLQKVGRFGEAAIVLQEASKRNPTHLQTAGNLAVALKQAGDLRGAEAAGALAVALAPANAQVRYNHGLTLQALGRMGDAAAEWRAALAVDPALVPALASLGHLAGHGGDLAGAKGWYEKALAALKAAQKQKPGAAAENAGAAVAVMSGEEGALRLQVATSGVPQIYGSAAHADAVRYEFSTGLRGLLGLPPAESGHEGPDDDGGGGDGIDGGDGDGNNLDHANGTQRPALCSRAGSFQVSDPLTSVGSGALGYYLIYTGHNDVGVRRLLAAAYWCGSPMLRFQAPFLSDHDGNRDGNNGGTSLLTETKKTPPLVRVGFMSAFFYHHSVGLLTRGVICGLAARPDKFHVTLLYASPLETVDDVTSELFSCVHNKVALPSNDLALSQHLVSAEHLDVLLFAEIGMDSHNYFLAFGRLARRSALFWGHATTSGISATDDPSRRNSSGGGGVDYFISSELFEAPFGGQQRYTERLYLMRGLTTKFKRPKTPSAATLNDLRLLGLPRLVPFRAGLGTSALVEGVDTAPESEGGKHLYLVPQTLYKLHPDFDRLLRGVLEADPNGVVAMPAAQESGWTEAASSRLAGSLGPALRARLVFFRRLDFAEFSALVQRAHVVLDPFPVGGGRSTFEVLAGHTPVVMLYPRTSILQLTHGMYVTMGIVRPVSSGNNVRADIHGRSSSGVIDHVSSESSLLVAHTESAFVTGAVAIATNSTLRRSLHERLAASSHKLYGRDDVVDEWAEFLAFASAAPRPAGGRWWRTPGGAGSAPASALRARSLFGDDPQPQPSQAALNTAIGRAGSANTAWTASPTKPASRRGGAVTSGTVAGGAHRTLSDGFDMPMLVDGTARKEERTSPLAVHSGFRGFQRDSSEAFPPVPESVRVERLQELHLQLTSSSQHSEWWFASSDHSSEDGASPIVANIERHRLPATVSAMAKSGSTWHWAQRPWGWEAVSGAWKSGMLAPNERARGLLYALKMSHDDERTGAATTLLVEIWEGGISAADTALLVAAHLGAEPVKAAWISCTLRRGASLSDSSAPVVWALPLSLRDASKAGAPPLAVPGAGSSQDWGWPRLEVRAGDDLAQAAGYFAYRFDLGDGARDWVRSRLEALTPEHASPAWAAGRLVDHQSCAAPAPPPLPPSPEPAVAPKQHHEGTRVACQLIVGITTCKRLELFRKTASSLLRSLGDDFRPGYKPSDDTGSGLPAPLVCRVVVIDDGSPMDQVVAMAAEFPSFEYVLKPKHRKGHAESLNLLLSLVRPRLGQEPGFFMYLEDDWLFLDEHPKALHDAVSILQASRRIRGDEDHGDGDMEPVDEVLLNDQASRACAYADTAACLATPMGSSGWGRKIVGTGNGSLSAPIEYRLHEFGAFGDRGFGFWPGFSLNPAVWDLAAIDSIVAAGGGGSLEFDTNDRRFEQSISLKLASLGARMAYLPRMTVRHLGTEASAYELNNMTRPWDRI